jgi:hypothetical protein
MTFFASAKKSSWVTAPLARDRTLQGELEVVQHLGCCEASRLDPVFGTMGDEGVYLFAQDRGQVALVIRALPDGRFGQGRPPL